MLYSNIFILVLIFISTMMFFKNSKLKAKILEANDEIKNKNISFQNVINAAVEMIVFYDENKIITDVNNAVVEMLKYKGKDEIINRNIIEFVAPMQLSKIQDAMSKDIVEPYELALLKKDNSILDTITSARYVMKDGRKTRMLTIMDFTNIKHQQKLLQQQSKLAQMGEMISMIAHQWRQPLNAISLTSSNLQFKCAIDDMDQKLFLRELKLIDKYSDHLSKTIDDFRGFFKDNKEKSTVSLKDIVNSTLEIVKTSLENKNIKLNLNFKKVEDIETYSNEIKQVVLNLIKNAEDILIENKISKPIIGIKIINTKDFKYNKLIITDNAGGIPENIISNIFDPYFSTKKEKDGTGLGLYMSKIIIEEHCGGELSVSNNKNGAVFTMKLPIRFNNIG